MFILLIISEALAEPAIPDIPSLGGRFPILETFGGIAILLVTIGMWLKAERGGQKKEGVRQADSEVHMHFDGPMVDALKTLKEISDTLKGIREEVPEAAKMVIAIREDLIKRDAEDRHLGRNELHREVQEVERKLEGFEGRLGRIAEEVAHLQGRFAARAPTRER